MQLGHVFTIDKPEQKYNRHEKRDKMLKTDELTSWLRYISD